MTYYKPYNKNKPLPYIAKVALTAQGLVAALMLNSAGYTKEEVYNRVQSIRPKALTIELQKEYFESFEV